MRLSIRLVFAIYLNSLVSRVHSLSFGTCRTGMKTKDGVELQQVNRRAFVSLVSSALISIPGYSRADEDSDLTTQLFNADGSLKENASEYGVTGELQFKTISSSFPGNDGTSVEASYNLPSLWKDNYMVLYPDGIEARACEEINIFQKADTATVKELEKASLVGVGRTLGLTDRRFLSADIIGGRKRQDDEGVIYFEFDIAVAPSSCAGNDKENLGLGFCSYDSIALLSATVLDGRMYVFSLECNKDEWKRSNSDLKLVRSSLKFKQQSSPSA